MDHTAGLPDFLKTGVTDTELIGTASAGIQDVTRDHIRGIRPAQGCRRL